MNRSPQKFSLATVLSWSVYLFAAMAVIAPAALAQETLEHQPPTLLAEETPGVTVSRHAEGTQRVWQGTETRDLPEQGVRQTVSISKYRFLRPDGTEFDKTETRTENRKLIADDTLSADEPLSVRAVSTVRHYDALGRESAKTIVLQSHAEPVLDSEGKQVGQKIIYGPRGTLMTDSAGESVLHWETTENSGNELLGKAGT